MLGIFSCTFVVCSFFLNHLFQKKKIRNTIRMSNSLNPDQAKHFVSPDLGPKLQMLSSDNTGGGSRISGKGVHMYKGVGLSNFS